MEKVFASYCASCHASSPLKASVRIATYDDLVAKASSDPARTLAEAAIARMRSHTMPPPPSAAPGEAEVAAVEKWIADGYPHGTCGSTNTTGDASTAIPPAATVVCTSGMTGPTKKGMSMNPGGACIRCHNDSPDNDEGPILHVGGTVYPTFHEPDRCVGTDGPSLGARVVITDATGKVFDLPVGSTGNFGLRLEDTLTFAMPFRAKVVVGGVERVMQKAQSNGDCNSCHTVQGANGAPGRIALP